MNTTTFAALGCSEPYLAALERRGFTTPTPVQAACFQPGLEGRDLLVQSRTGSGKTLAFGLPLLHRFTTDKHPQALILAPTRELAQQVAEELRSVQPRLNTALLVGGLSYLPQLKDLKYGASLIVGTPGRVMDHLDRGSLDLSKVSMIVLDECDEMLNMGFIEDVEKILAQVPEGPQTYLFSATLPAPIASLAKRFLKDPFRVQMADTGGAAHHADIAHTPCLVADHLQTKALVNLLLLDEPSSALIFTKMKQQTEEVAEALRNAGLAADYLHGDLNQGARNRIMSSFKEGKLRYLVATDVAARGIDVEGMPLVVHMGIPTQFENYIHRSGRTGRAGSKGTSLALVSFKESRILLAWGRRGGLTLDWRALPSQAEIREARSRRLAERVTSQEAPAFLKLAQKMLEERPAESLVAALLSLIEDEAHSGYDIPDAPRSEFKKERKAFAPRPGEKPGWAPGSKPASRKPDARLEERPRTLDSRPESKFEDRPKPYAKKSGPYENRFQDDRKGPKPGPGGFKDKTPYGKPAKPFKKKD